MDPAEIGEDYRRVDGFDLLNDSWEEVLFLDPKGGSRADIRISVRTDEEERQEYERDPRYKGVNHGTFELAKALRLTEVMDRDADLRFRVAPSPFARLSSGHYEVPYLRQ